MRKIILIILFSIIFPVGFSFASTTNGTINPTAGNNYKAKLLVDDSTINFGYFPVNNPDSQVHVTASELTGYIWGESIGWISLNCGNNSSCGSSNFKVENTNSGVLSGYAWGENAGWVNFGPFENSSTNSVVISNDGNFTGYAWSENYGWIEFNCSNADSCVNTDWRHQGGGGAASSGGGTGVPIGTTGTATTTTGTTDGSTTGTSSASSGTSTTSGTSGTGTGVTGGSGFGGLSGSGTAGGSTGFGVGGMGSGTSSAGTSGSGAAAGTSSGASSGATTGGTTGGSSGSGGCPPGFFNGALCTIIDTYHFTAGVLSQTSSQIRPLLDNPTNDALTKLIALVGLIFGAIFTVLPVVFGTPLSFSEIILIPYRLWSLLLSVFGLRKRNRPWGTVYDSVTKQPLDPVVVTLQDVEGKEISTSITDMDGRYGFLVPPGKYRIIPAKTHYAFPSLKMVGKTRDEIYLDLYFGYVFEIKEEGEVIKKNIPMDPEGFDWNEFAKRDQKLMVFYSKRDRIFTKISDVLFSVGFTVSLVALLAAPSVYNGAIFFFYVIIMIIKETGLRGKAAGRIIEKVSRAPLSFGLVRVYLAKTDTLIATKVANKLGIYYCLIQNGDYYVTIEKKNANESYTLLYKSELIHVTQGFLNNSFEV